MKRRSSFAMMVWATICSMAAHAQTSIPFYRNLRNPESVISDGKFLYVTEIGSKLAPSEKDGDGAVVKLTLDGKLVSKNMALSTLHAPKGMAIVKNILYVADVDRLVGMDLSSGKIVDLIDFSNYHTNLMNDVTAKGDTVLLATASDIHKVFSIDLKRKDRVDMLPIADVMGANGICYDKKSQRAYVNGIGSFEAASGIGEVGYIEWGKKGAQFHKITGAKGFFDGMAVLEPGKVLVTDWVSMAQPLGVLKEITVQTGKATVISDKIGGPADIYYDQNKHFLYIPATLQGVLLKVTF